MLKHGVNLIEYTRISTTIYRGKSRFKPITIVGFSLLLNNEIITEYLLHPQSLFDFFQMNIQLIFVLKDIEVIGFNNHDITAFLLSFDPLVIGDIETI